MISTLIILAVFLQAPVAIHSLPCIKCDQPLNLNTAGPIVAPPVTCTTTVDLPVCKATLRLTYQTKIGSIAFGGETNTELLLINGDQLTMQQTMIRLNVDKVEQSVELSCYKNASCVNNIAAFVADGKCATVRICLPWIE